MNTNEYKWKQANKKSGCNTLRPKFHQNQVSSNLPSIDATFPVVSVELPSNIKTTYDDKNSDTVKTSYTCIFRVILANTVTNSALWSAMRSALWLWPMMVRWRSNWQAMQGLDHRLAGPRWFIRCWLHVHSSSPLGSFKGTPHHTFRTESSCSLRWSILARNLSKFSWLRSVTDPFHCNKKQNTNKVFIYYTLKQMNGRKP